MLFELVAATSRSASSPACWRAICSCFCPPCCDACGGTRLPPSTTASPTPSWWRSSRRSPEHLKLTSRLDGLTGIANRAHLDDSLARPGAAATGPRPPLLVLVDVDYFKQFNDHYGHQLGTSVCSRWRACWPRCCAGRTIWPPVTGGGVRPAAALHHLAGAMQIAEQVRTALRTLGIPTTSPGSRAGQLQLRGGDPGAGTSTTPSPISSKSGCGPLPGQA